MECEDYKQKFEDIDGWEKAPDDTEAYVKLFKFTV